MIDLDAIRARCIATVDLKFESVAEYEDAAEQAFADRESLLAEVERLRQQMAGCGCSHDARGIAFCPRCGCELG